MLLGLNDKSSLSRYEQYETQYPSPRKELEDRVIYMSRPVPLSRTMCLPLLSDLSEARFDSDDNTDLIMPSVYRAPEVILCLPWSFPVDVWSVAMVVDHINIMFCVHGTCGV